MPTFTAGGQNVRKFTRPIKNGTKLCNFQWVHSPLLLLPRPPRFRRGIHLRGTHLSKLRHRRHQRSPLQHHQLRPPQRHQLRPPQHHQLSPLQHHQLLPTLKLSHVSSETN